MAGVFFLFIEDIAKCMCVGVGGACVYIYLEYDKVSTQQYLPHRDYDWQSSF